ncbi:MAG TPA: GntR family transcriptional regulator [Streptosporangiaceae bacterium]
MTIDHGGDRALFKQLADLIRAQIDRNEFEPGQRLPAEHDYAEEHDLSRDTVRRALAILRNEGLIITSRRGSHVRKRTDLRPVVVEQGRIYARMPTARERRELKIDEGVPLLIVERDGRDVEVHPADRTVLQILPPE